jgi:DNA helicase-2/ATP-dependent DNA helicase PcrA
VVGDADQSIYAFRGATIRNILEFERDYPDARTILLEQNYRSTQTILTAANSVINRNRDRKPKNLWSDQGAGEPIVGYVADNEHAEADWVAREIDRLTDAGEARPADVAVFYRTNAQSRVFEEIFIRLGLPYKVVGGVRFYERKEVRDALAYLRAIINLDDTVSVRRVLNTPRRGIGDRAVGCVEAVSSKERISFGAALRRAEAGPGMPPRAATAIADFLALLDELREMSVVAPPEEFLEAVLRRTGYIDELEESTDPQDEGRVENLMELVSVAREYTERVELLAAVAEEAGEPVEPPSLHGFLEQVSLVADADEIPSDDPEHVGVVTLMTLHTAKGLEFPVVFLTGLGGRRLPAPALAGRPAGARGGAPPRLRRHHPGPAAALPVAGDHPVGLGRRLLQPAVAVPRGGAGGDRAVGAHRVAYTSWSGRGGVGARGEDRPDTRNPHFVGGTPKAAEMAARLGIDASKLTTAAELRNEVPALEVGDRVNHQRWGVGRVLAIEGHGVRAQAQIDFGDQVMWIVLRHAPSRSCSSPAIMGDQGRRPVLEINS